ncbi:Tumor_necrosis factor receptor-associated factor 3 [Hexamita inflata]|uniref:Tumor necrosis factor receptor-associated factor 3 n=1 Tax=Hexamita inflata TaxID=28002 RepID=A0AA86P2M3_9EUKA|nr:Tumor necrosis factor receptor-associated factor 3 [Hexamita inflata]
MSSLQQIKRYYQNFVPYQINAGQIETKNKNNSQANIKSFNPSDFSITIRFPSSELPSNIPADFRPTIIGNQSHNDIICTKCNCPAIEPTMYMCGCCVCYLCNKLLTNVCSIHQQPHGQVLDLTYDQKEQLNNQFVNCVFKGCSEKIAMSNFINHINSCEYSTIQCPFCSSQGNRIGFDNHFDICPKLPRHCRICGQDVQPSQIGPHVEECHPVCLFCGERKLSQDDGTHDAKLCNVPGCGETIADCVLKKHMNNTDFYKVHCGQLVDDLFEIETECQETQFNINKLQTKKNQLIESQQNLVLLKQQLREVTLQRDRIQLLSQAELPDIVEVATIIKFHERVKIAHDLMLNIIQFQGKKQTQNQNIIMLLPRLIKFNSNLQVQVKYGTQIDLIRAQSEFEFMNIISLDIDSRITGILSFALILKHFLTQTNEILSTTEQTCVEVFNQLSEYIINNVQQCKYIVLFIKGIKTIFETIFYDILFTQCDFEKDFESQFNIQLFEYFSFNGSEQEYNVINTAQPLQNKLDIDQQAIEEFVQIFQLPILKYTQINYQINIFSIQIPGFDRTVLDYYDYVLVSPKEDIFILAMKVLIRLFQWPQQQPRVLVLRPSQNCKQLITIIPSNSLTLHINHNQSMTDLFGFEQIVFKCQELQEIEINSDSYNMQYEFTSDKILHNLSMCQNLQILKIKNQRFSEKASQGFQYIQQLNLTQFHVDDCEICYPSMLKVNFQYIQDLVLKLKCLESRKRLYESDLSQMLMTIANCPTLESLELSLNNEFSINQKAASSFIESCTQLQRLQQLKINKCQLRNEAFISICNRLHEIPRLNYLSLAQNPLFSNDAQQVDLCTKALSESWIQMHGLIELDLSDTRLNGKALECISTLVTSPQQKFSFQQGLQTLKILNLSKNKLSDIDMKQVGKIILKTPLLEALDITHCRDISERGVTILKGRLSRGFRLGYEFSQEISDKLAQIGLFWSDGVYIVNE